MLIGVFQVLPLSPETETCGLPAELIEAKYTVPARSAATDGSLPSLLVVPVTGLSVQDCAALVDTARPWVAPHLLFGR